MARHWTFGRKIGAGFAVLIMLAATIGVVAITALRGVVEEKDRAIAVDGENLIDAEKLGAAQALKVVAVRGFILDKDERNLQELRAQRENFRLTLGRLRARSNAEGRGALDRVEVAEADYHTASEHVIALRNTNVPLDAVIRKFTEDLVSRRETVAQATDAYIALASSLRDAATQSGDARARTATAIVIIITLLAVAAASVIAFVLARTLGRQIGSAVGQVQSSSGELQAAANQQATGAKEQSTAMNEITTTIRELLATSHQIAESAQRVASVSEQTVGAARLGEGTVQKAAESIAGIRRQVDLVVHHMLALGKKSQQIGAVLDIVSELAEQTNILAINATIEAAGAGETGKRFAVVADEIRKLADRVAGSTKEIRGLIEDVRSAVNTTVMATEAGSKTVDAGDRQFAEVAVAFKQIADLVSTTTEVAREIELSTKQQTTAVEQVNVAIANTTQATKEAEASSSQTLQTASHLATLSKGLLRLVQSQANAA